MAWSVPRLHPGATVYCLGAGPSLSLVDAAKLRGRPYVACNSAMMWARDVWGPGAYALSYHSEYIQKNEADYQAFHAAGGQVLTPVGTQQPAWVRQLHTDQQRGLCRSPTGLGHGLNTGHGALNLAYHLGAARIVLLGYDMRMCRDGRVHWDGRATDQAWKYATLFARAFRKIAADLKEVGVSVLNATPRSALEAFPRISLADAFDENAL